MEDTMPPDSTNQLHLIDSLIIFAILVLIVAGLLIYSWAEGKRSKKRNEGKYPIVCFDRAKIIKLS